MGGKVKVELVFFLPGDLERSKLLLKVKEALVCARRKKLYENRIEMSRKMRLSGGSVGVIMLMLFPTRLF